MTRALADGRTVTGVDISARQIELARAAVPGARFIHADMTGLDLPSDSLDAVVAYYSLTHVPRADLPGLLAAIHRGSDRAACWSPRWAPEFAGRRRTRLAPRHDVLQPLRAKKDRALVRRAGSRSSWRSSRRTPGPAAALFLLVIARKPCQPGPDVDAPGTHPVRFATMLADIREAIMAVARAEYPDEASGIVVSDRTAAAGGRALRFVPMRNAAASPLATGSTTTSCSGCRSNDDADEAFSAIVHSRVRSPAVPSPTDVGQATIYRDPLYVLVSLSDEEADAATGSRASGPGGSSMVRSRRTRLMSGRRDHVVVRGSQASVRLRWAL